MTILQAVLDSHKSRGWIDVPALEEGKR